MTRTLVAAGPPPGLWSVWLGTSWVLVEASSSDAAIAQVAERMGVTHRPWVWRRWNVRAATANDVKLYGAIVDRKRSPAKSSTAENLRKRHPSLFEDDDE